MSEYAAAFSQITCPPHHVAPESVLPFSVSCVLEEELEQLQWRSTSFPSLTADRIVPWHLGSGRELFAVPVVKVSPPSAL